MKIIETNDAIEVSDGAEKLSTRDKIILSVAAIIVVTLFFGTLGPFAFLGYPICFWYIWKPYTSTSFLFDRKTLKVYKVETKKQQRQLEELAHFSELSKFRIIEEQESESQGSDGMGAMDFSD